VLLFDSLCLSLNLFSFLDLFDFDADDLISGHIALLNSDVRMVGVEFVGLKGEVLLLVFEGVEVLGYVVLREMG
jgi:hypothetical protein